MRSAYITIAMILFLTACSSPQILISTPSVSAADSTFAKPTVVPAQDITLLLPAVVYGVSPQGDQLSEADDACGVLNLLYSAVYDRLERRFKLMPSARDASPKTARLKLTIVDVVTISIGGPTIVMADAEFEQPGQPTAHYRALREGSLKWSEITADSTECSMIDAVVDALALDITTWTLTQSFAESP
ncbi:hypothetical protein [Pseudomonas sp. OV226]|uniref:hypothetical protein n=1 Tax=Pseudomonas sp. OV226 TaxID=2135588 RepID=UPI000D6C7C7D|nr:hypothetical protein [Pseudomonas sp. OV226]PWK39423.1 hypothetical protein C7534_113121 [Pseudomonas sp. OV226]